MKKKLKNIIQFILIITSVVLVAGYGINTFVVDSSSDKITTAELLKNSTEKYDCIFILGCGVHSDGSPSDMLEDRLKTGISLYKSGVAPKILMSGDHGRNTYDEVNTMKSYAITNGVPSEDIFMDHAGFSTYESLYRAKEIFTAENIIIVTQNFHLNRALYIASSLGINSYGIGADLRKYRGQKYVILREMLARDKDFVKCIIKPKPTYLGDTIPVSGDGNITND